MSCVVCVVTCGGFKLLACKNDITSVKFKLTLTLEVKEYCSPGDILCEFFCLF